MNIHEASDTIERTEAATTKVQPDDEAAFGLWAPAVTPLDSNLAPDARRYVMHVRRLLENGCHGIAVFGTTGEATSFSVDERLGLLEATLTAGVPAHRLMVGTGCSALSDTIRLTRETLRLGCNKVLMLPPFYYKGVSDEGLYASYAAVIDRIAEPGLKLYLYHFPRLSMVPITHAVITRLCENYPGVVAGLKDSSGDPDSTRAFISAFPDLHIFPGTETLMLAALEQGGAGCITASANVNAPALRRLYEAWREKDPAAPSLQQQISAVRAVLQSQPMIPVLKYLLAGLYDDAGWRQVRPPLTSLPSEVGASLEQELTALGFKMTP